MTSAFQTGRLSGLERFAARELARLPATFASSLADRLREWDRLFPAEKNYYERLFALLDRTEPPAVERLFRPLRELEQRMGVSEKTWPRGEFTLAQVDFLNRSPYYAQWRKAVAEIFSELDPILEAEVARVGRPRLVIVISPAQLPVGPDRMWTRLRQQGRMIELQISSDNASDAPVEEYLPEMLTGAKRQAAQPTLMELYAGATARSPYDVWLVETGNSVLPLAKKTGGWVQLNYDRLEDYRARLMAEVRRMVETQDIRGPRQLGEKLRQLQARSGDRRIDADPIVAEFTRSVLLNGNGTLLINNTFVEWAAVQAVRRARPSVAVVSFGIRNKIKPFSSLLIYTDQEAATPIPTQMDTLGSYVDLEMLNYYVWLEFEKYAEYRRNTVYLMVGEGMDQMLVIAPPDFSLRQASRPVKVSQVFSAAKEWLNL